jgi:hypothetical protein
MAMRQARQPRNDLDYSGIKAPLTKTQQLANLLKKQGGQPINILNDAMQSGGGAIQQKLQPNENFVDFKQVQESVQESAPPSMGSSVLASLKQLASNPATYRNIANIGSLIAAYEGDQGLANTLSTVSSQLDQGITRSENSKAQRDILEQQRLAREQEAIIKKEKSDARKAKMYLDIAQAKKITSGMGEVPIDYEQITLDTYNQYPSVYKKYLRKFKKADGSFNYGLKTSGSEKIEKEMPVNRDSVRTAQANAKRIGQKITEITKDKNFNSLIGKFKFAGLNLNKKETKEIFKQITAEEEGLLAKLQSISSATLIDTLQNMRSKITGATGFGQLNEKEFEALKSALEDLRTAQDPKTLRKALFRIKEKLEINQLQAESDYKQIYGDLPKTFSIPVTKDLNLPAGGIERGAKPVISSGDYIIEEID